MPRNITAFVFVAGFAMYACGSSDTGSASASELAADQIDSAAAALTGATPDGTFAAMTASDTGAAGAAEGGRGARAGGAGHMADHDGDGPGKGHGGHGRGHGGGPGAERDGQQLLLWYADFAALQTCRDQRESCTTSADTSSCEQAAHDCVKPVLEAAFAAFCSDELAKCSDASASASACQRISSRCASSMGSGAASDAGA